MTAETASSGTVTFTMCHRLRQSWGRRWFAWAGVDAGGVPVHGDQGRRCDRPLSVLTLLESQGNSEAL